MMKNHKWAGDTCIRCGLKREKHHEAKIAYQTSRLNRFGVWVPCDVLTYVKKWYYGAEHQFVRPECKN